jgi:hypothetical protein
MIAPELHPGQVTNDQGHGLWYVFTAGMSSWRLVWAPTAERAVKRFKNATSARPVRPSGWWQSEEGAAHKPKLKRRRK